MTQEYTLDQHSHWIDARLKALHNDINNYINTLKQNVAVIKLNADAVSDHDIVTLYSVLQQTAKDRATFARNVASIATELHKIRKHNARRLASITLPEAEPKIIVLREDSNQ